MKAKTVYALRVKHGVIMSIYSHLSAYHTIDCNGDIEYYEHQETLELRVSQLIGHKWRVPVEFLERQAKNQS